MMRPTLRAVFFFAFSIPVALVIVTWQPQVWYASFYFPAAVLALLGADMVAGLHGSRLRIDAQGPKMLYVGQSDNITLDINAQGYPHIVPVQALLEQTGAVETPIPVAGSIEDGTLTLGLPLTPTRRGQVRVNAVWLRWNGPLGFMQMRKRQAVDKSIDVVPDVHGIHEAAIRFFSRDAVFGLKNQRQRGEGTEFDNLREYSLGMDSRFIDWKHSARHRKLLCKEFRQERNHQIVLSFDTGHLMLEPVDGIPKLDHAIKAWLVLGWTSLRSGDLIGGCWFDLRFRSFIKPGRGMPYFTQFQRFSASLAYRTEETNFTVGLAELNARLHRRSLIVLFTEFIDTISAELLLESLQLLARRHVVLFVTMRDPLLPKLQSAPPKRFANVAEAVIADDFLRERAIVLKRAARLGVHCLDVPVQGLSAALLNRYLLIKQRGLL